jgi:hypothetical protein
VPMRMAVGVRAVIVVIMVVVVVIVVVPVRHQRLCLTARRPDQCARPALRRGASPPRAARTNPH